MHYWVDLQSVHGFRCYDNIVLLNAKCQRVLVHALCLVVFDMVTACEVIFVSGISESNCTCLTK